MSAMNAVTFAPCLLAAWRPARPRRRQPRHPHRRIHRRAGAERRRQDDVDARHSRPGAAEQRHDRACSARPAARGNPAIGYMPQVRGHAPGLRLSGWDFVAERRQRPSSRPADLGKAERAEVDRALDLVGARDLARRPLAEMSGGERQRLLLAQALIGRPRLLLLDEPLISLDPHHQQRGGRPRQIAAGELGITVLFSAHELNPLLGALDRVLYLGRGQAALGTVDEVITGPVLSRLYGADIEVVRLKGRIFVMSGGHDVEREAHRHDHGHGHRHRRMTHADHV